MKTKDTKMKAFIACALMLAVLMVVSGCGGGGDGDGGKKPSVPSINNGTAQQLTVNTTQNSDDESFTINTSQQDTEGTSFNKSSDVKLYTTPDPANQEPVMTTAKGRKLYDRNGSWKAWLQINVLKFDVAGNTCGESAIDYAVESTISTILHSTSNQSTASQVVYQQPG